MTSAALGVIAKRLRREAFFFLSSPALGAGERVCIARDTAELDRHPKTFMVEGCVVYRYSELERIVKDALSTLAIQRVHEVKKIFGGSYERQIR